MKTLKSYTPILIQAALLIAGYLMINVGLANEITTSVDANTTLTTNETELEVEDWMTDLSFWNNNENKKEEKEETSSNTSVNYSTNNISLEEELILEDWMTDASNKFWKNNNKNLQTDAEEDLEIEEWMTDLDVWNN